MYYCYILQSNKNKRYYIGSTENVSKRLKRHNSGLIKPTKPYVPWELIYKEEYKMRKESFLREKQIKSWKKRKSINV
jgi:putative endonuclease